MTPKKEAKNLINEYRMILMNENTECGNEILCTSIAKKCALIAVDEIIKYLELDGFSTQIEHWQEVKNQINKL